ncbi:MAG: hypothetical protein OEV49_13985 [candidate division Zixibacteria bacterium]|nr:hypothetical protein [candidate division Zixibacteria bacterium]MDH3938895.1 hypothetical protein [candidate division Zixibacteria bacterium]MDH4035339.1 hypothetical protein [candidate division Zixibacteria bacterium]
MKTTVPVAVAFLAGLALVVSFFFREGTFVGDISQELTIWLTIVGGFTLLLGVVSITRVNWSAVKMRKEGWGYKLLTLISIFAMAIPAILPESWSSLFGRNEGSIYDWLFVYLDSPMMATMFATLAFYIASAAYRAFRARSAESTILLLTATVVMLWRVPMGEAFLNLLPGDIPGFLNSYVMNGANLAVQRGIIIGAALGAASMSLRIILGIERTYMGKG